MEIQKPEYKWYYFIPFTRGRKDYIKDRELYENQFMKESEKVTRHIEKHINGVSALLITIITSLWTLLPPLIDLPNWLQWTKMGMEGFGFENWGNQLMLTIVPSVGGFMIHKAPYFIPKGKVRWIANISIKSIPSLILTIVAYIPIMLKKYFKWRAIEKEQVLQEAIKKTP